MLHEQWLIYLAYPCSGGHRGFSQVIWTVKEFVGGGDSPYITLYYYHSFDGEQGNSTDKYILPQSKNETHLFQNQSSVSTNFPNLEMANTVKSVASVLVLYSRFDRLPGVEFRNSKRLSVTVEQVSQATWTCTCDVRAARAHERDGRGQGDAGEPGAAHVLEPGRGRQRRRPPQHGAAVRVRQVSGGKAGVYGYDTNNYAVDGYAGDDGALRKVAVVRDGRWSCGRTSLGCSSTRATSSWTSWGRAARFTGSTARCASRRRTP